MPITVLFSLCFGLGAGAVNSQQSLSQGTGNLPSTGPVLDPFGLTPFNPSGWRLCNKFLSLKSIYILLDGPLII